MILGLKTLIFVPKSKLMAINMICGGRTIKIHVLQQIKEKLKEIEGENN